MKEITLPIGQIFDRLLGKDISLDTFIDSPVPIQMQNEEGVWCNVPAFVKKRDDLYEVKFSDGSTLTAGGSHYLCAGVSKYARVLVHVKDLYKGFTIDYKNISVESVEKIGEGFVYDLQIDTPSHLYQTADGLIHHNTFTVKQAGEAAIGRHPKGFQFKIVAGDVGASISSVLYMLWKYRDGFVLCLDDCDTMIKSKTQSVANMLKAALDPDIKPFATGSFAVRKEVQKMIDADPDLNRYYPLSKHDWLKKCRDAAKAGEPAPIPPPPKQWPKKPVQGEKPETVDTTSQAAIHAVIAEEEKEEAPKTIPAETKLEDMPDSVPTEEAIEELEQKIEDADSKQEIITILNTTEVDVKIPKDVQGLTDADLLKSVLAELEALKKETEELRVQKAKPAQSVPAPVIPKQKKAVLTWDPKVGYKTVFQEAAEPEKPEVLSPEEVEEEGEFDVPGTFTFFSSVIFISNLAFKEVNSAVLGRCVTVGIFLSREEFMMRLEVVLGNMGKEDKELSLLSQEKLDWAKANSYTMLKSLIQAEAEKRPLTSAKIIIQINRKLTFRSIDDLMTKFLGVENMLNLSMPGFKDITSLEEKAKLMTEDFFNTVRDYLSQDS